MKNISKFITLFGLLLLPIKSSSATGINAKRLFFCPKTQGIIVCSYLKSKKSTALLKESNADKRGKIICYNFFAGQGKSLSDLANSKEANAQKEAKFSCRLYAEQSAALIFDLDDTICYPEKPFKDVFENFFQVPFEAVSAKWLEALYCQPNFKGHEVIAYTLPRLQPNQARLKAKKFAKIWAENNRLYPGIYKILKSLCDSKIKTGLLTNGPVDFQFATVDHLEISKFFNHILISGDIGVRKPDTKIYKILQERIGLCPENMIMIGDNLQNDILAAQKAGWNFLWVKSKIDSLNCPQNSTIKLSWILDNKLNNTADPFELNWEQVHMELLENPKSVESSPQKKQGCGE